MDLHRPPVEARRRTDEVWSGLEGGAPGQLGVLQLFDAGEVPVDEAGVGERPEVLGGLEWGASGRIIPSLKPAQEAPVLLAADRRDAAREPLDTLTVIAERAGTPFSRAALIEARALLAAHEREAEAPQLWADAADAWQAMGMPFQEQRARSRALGCPAIPAPSRDSAATPPTNPPPTCPLTRREREVLAAVARGESSAAVAAVLVLSEHTVHRHVANILTKLDVPTRAAAVALAARERWI